MPQHKNTVGIDTKTQFVTEAAPVFEDSRRLTSPYAGRIEALFHTLREPVVEIFEDLPPRQVTDREPYLQHLEAVYEHDAYNSLSIEGYRVTPVMNIMLASGGYPWTIVPTERFAVDRRLNPKIACKIFVAGAT